MPEPWRFGLAAGAGALVRMACPTYDWWWIAPVALIPLLAALEGLNPKKASQIAFVTGFVWSLWAFFWITTLLIKFSGMSVLAATPLAVVFAAWHGVSFGVLGAATAYFRQKTDWPLWLFVPPIWVCIEAAWPSIFPFYLAVTVSAQPLLAQTAELGSVTLVGALLFAFNAALYELGRARRLNLPQRVHAGVAVALAVATLLYGAVRMGQVDEQVAQAKTLRVGVVQGNMSINEIYDKKKQLGILHKQQRVSARLELAGAKLVVWGETSVPSSHAFSRAAMLGPKGEWEIHKGFSVPALVGANTLDEEASPYGWNTAILVEDGTLTGLYDKVFLLVFGEYVPVVDPEWFKRQVQGAAHLNAGPGPVAFETGGVRILPLICYEGILPRFVREGALLGVHFFANLTNDAWFGKTHESAQHLGLATLRSIEHRKPMVRAVNTGISSYIDPNGRVIHRTELVDPDVDGPKDAVGFNVDVPLMDPDHRTLYGLTGELFNLLCAGFLLVALARSRRRQS